MSVLARDGFCIGATDPRGTAQHAVSRQSFAATLGAIVVNYQYH